MSNLINETESARLDALTAYNSTLLNSLSGDVLDAVLPCKRRGLSNADFRQRALNTTHPDDLATTLVLAGYSLVRLGIASLEI